MAAFNKAWDLQKAAKYREALPLYERALELAPKAYGKDDLANTAVILNHLGIVYSDMGQYAKAEPFYQRSLQIREAKLGKDHPQVAESLHNLAHLYRDMGQYAKAEPLFQRSLDIWDAKRDPRVTLALNNLAALYAVMGQYAKAEPLYRRGLQISQANRGKDHPDVADSLRDLAGLYWDMGQYAKAEPLYQRSLEIFESKLGKDHPIVARSLNGLALVYWSMGQYAKAEPLYLRSLEIRQAKLGKDHPLVAESLNNLAVLYKVMGQYAKAEPLHQHSLAIREAKLGRDHPHVAGSLNNLAELYRNMGQYAKAEPLYQRSLEINETSLGKDHPEVARGLNNLGELYRRMGQYAKARPLLERGLQLMGEEHPDITDCLSNLAQLHAAQEQWTEATRLTNQLRQRVRAHVRRTLPVLSEREQLVFLENTEAERLNVTLSLGLERRTDRDLASASAAWLLNAKAIAQESLSERARLALASTDPQTGKIASQLTSVRQQLAALTLAIPKSEEEKRKQIATLTEQEQQLSRKLGQSIGQPGRTDPWVTIAELRQALPADGILIEVARFQVKDFKAKGDEKQWKGQRYAAWLIPPAGQGEVQLIDLGEADTIDAAVAAVRKGLLAAQGTATRKSIISEKGEPDAEKELQPALAALAKLVLEPLAEHVNGKKQWLVSPDGALWLVPWAALPLKDGSYAIEKHQISHVISGRDLVTPPFKGTVKRDAPLIMADPDFDIEPKQAAALTASLLGTPAPVDNGPLAALDNPQGNRSASLIGRVGRLPDAAAEAVAIKPKLQIYAGEEPWVYRGKNALEGVFKSFRSPKVVVLSTHGFFLEDQEVKRSDRPELGDKRPALDKDGKLLENPLLRCGLLLAGCNQRSKVTGKQEDGVLTGLEIVGCDLRGTELVVLSACETGLGQVRNGEGVAGLRQAFQLAGAQTVVASLWQVSDRETALLMSDFFDSLAKGKAKAEALREAQLARIKAHRDRDGAAHPFFWAAFTVTGK